MDAYEAEQRAAEKRSAELFSLGWQAGVGATVWARAASDELERHQAARQAWAATPTRELWERLHASAMMAVVAVDLVLSFEKRVRKLTGDAELQKARQEFDRAVPQTEALRDLIAHLDEYAVGQGQRQVGKRLPPMKSEPVSALLYWTETGHSWISLGDAQVGLEAAVQAASALAEIVERVRERHLTTVSLAANEALRRRFGSN